jgi:hypothetical protein
VNGGRVPITSTIIESIPELAGWGWGEDNQWPSHGQYSKDGVYFKLFSENVAPKKTKQEALVQHSDATKKRVGKVRIKHQICIISVT